MEPTSDESPGDAATPDQPQQRGWAGTNLVWLELFFDLVAVAAIAVLSEGLREELDLPGLGMFVLLYSALWLAWITVVLYANVAGGRTRLITVLVAMFLFAVMAASAPNHFEQRANLFGLAFLILRAMVAGATRRTGRLLTSWPLLQTGGVGVLWIVAFWVPVPAKFWLWGIALVLDLILVIRAGDADVDQVVSSYNRRHRRRGRERRSDEIEPGADLQRADLDRHHLDERLGTFVIIVLGEAVMALVLAAATHEWTRVFDVTLAMAFVLLVGLWWLTFSYGFAAAPHTRLADLPPRFGLPLHLLSTGGIVCLAAAVGALAGDPTDSAEPALVWLACAGLSVHFLAGGVSGLASGASRTWLLAWALPSVLAPLLVAPLVADERPEFLLVGLLVVIGWQVAYSLRPPNRPEVAVGPAASA